MLSHSFYKLLFILLLTSVSAAPSSKPVKRATIDTSQYCGQWDSVQAGPYSLSLDQWGMERASSGSACASLTSLSDTTVAWTTTWNWAGDDIKSYTNMQLNDGVNKQLSDIKSIPAKWQWSQSSSGPIMSNVAYDFFTSYTPGGERVNEVMVWLANFNSGPISTSLAINGTPIAITNNIFLAGHNWDLYNKANGTTNIYSFLPSDHAPITSFEGDINTFFTYLTSQQGVSTSQYLTTAQGGTEATFGSATLTSSVYSMAIESKQDYCR